MTLRHRIRFYQQLSMLVRAGVPIRGGLDRLRKKMGDRELKILSAKVENGDRIADAFEAAGFAPFEVHLVAAGEKSAQLDAIFTHLSEFWTRELSMRQALIRPLYYPIVILHLVALMSAGIQVVTAGVPAALAQLFWTLLGLYATCFVLFIAVKISWGSGLMRRIWLRVPIIGRALKTTYAYRWITTLRLEFSAGVSLYRAVGDAWRASGFVGANRRAVEGEEEMLKGVALSKLVERWRQLPRDWIDFIETGEISGKMEEAFKALEAEAAELWSLAQKTMSEWVPKILYFAALIYVAIQVGSLMYKVEIAPISDVEKQIDDMSK